MLKLTILLLTLSIASMAADPTAEALKTRIAAEKAHMNSILENLSGAKADWYQTPQGHLQMAQYYQAADNIIAHFEGAANGIFGGWNLELGRAYRNHKECIIAEVKQVECDSYVTTEMRQAARDAELLINDIIMHILPSIRNIEKGLVLFIAPESQSELNQEVKTKIRHIAERAVKAQQLFDAAVDFIEKRKFFVAR